MALSRDPNLWDRHFVLIRDLDMIGVEPNAVRPIGEPGPAPFVGVLDGGGHVIRHLRMVQPDEILLGLLGQIGQGMAHLDDAPWPGLPPPVLGSTSVTSPI